MLAAAEAGADVVDVAFDAMSGTTSQPSLGALSAALQGSPLDTGLDLVLCNEINDYWEKCRELYAPFEANQKTGNADVYLHEMPGGQMTNLMFQASSLGLADQWMKIKKAYATANLLLGDIIKVTPTSKVVGDLAQFMVQNELEQHSLLDKAATLSFPTSVVEYFQGLLGQPPGGFPEPLRTHVLKGKNTVDGRPGASMPPLDFDSLKESLQKKYGTKLSEMDVCSASMYPKVFDEYAAFRKQFGDISWLPTRYFIRPMRIGEDLSFKMERGVTLDFKLNTIGLLDKTGQREVFFEVNGGTRSILVPDKTAAGKTVTREKADPTNAGSVGAPMAGLVIELRCKDGQEVKSGDPVAVLSAMKMEMVVSAPVAGKIVKIAVKVGDSIAAADLIALIHS